MTPEQARLCVVEHELEEARRELLAERLVSIDALIGRLRGEGYKFTIQVTDRPAYTAWLRKDGLIVVATDDSLRSALLKAEEKWKSRDLDTRLAA